MCQCPDPIQPPNSTIRNCRLLLQGLAVGMLVLMVLAIFVSDIISIIYYFMFIYMLYLSWTQFNWCTTLFFFIFATLQCIIAIISLIGIISNGLFFDHQYVLVSIYALVSVLYFVAAVFLSHYAYKHFKNLGMGGLGFGPERPEEDQNNNYQRFQQQRQRPNREETANQNQNNDVFQGQGVRIG